MTDQITSETVNIDEQYERKATLTLTLKADSGYFSNEIHRVSADQWARILGVCFEREGQAHDFPG